MCSILNDKKILMLLISGLIQLILLIICFTIYSLVINYLQKKNYNSQKNNWIGDINLPYSIKFRSIYFGFIISIFFIGLIISYCLYYFIYILKYIKNNGNNDTAIIILILITIPSLIIILIIIIPLFKTNVKITFENDKVIIHKIFRKKIILKEKIKNISLSKSLHNGFTIKIFYDKTKIEFSSLLKKLYEYELLYEILKSNYL